MHQCMVERGILLVQPEHVVSLKLMSAEEQLRGGKLTLDPSPKLQKIYKDIMTALSLKSLLPEKDSVVGSMLRWLSLSSDHSGTTDPTQPEAVHHNDHNQNARGAGGSAFRWLSLRKFIDSHFRDILDESDEILHSRFQLIYTIGSQQHMDGYPDRWMITQQVLRLVKKHIYSLSRQTPDSVQYECGPPGSFPHVRIMHADIGRRLITSITEDVMAGRLPSFNFRHRITECNSRLHIRRGCASNSRYSEEGGGVCQGF
ncbi:Protein of unknown function (DUF3638) domain containing protein [Tylopilus felleus]